MARKQKTVPVKSVPVKNNVESRENRQVQKSLLDFPLGKLKEMAYDQMALLERVQMNLRQINQVIAQKVKDGNNTVPAKP